MATPMVGPDVAQSTVTQPTLTQSTLGFSRPTSIRTGPKPTGKPFLTPIRWSAPATAVVNATKTANEAALLRQVTALPVQLIEEIDDLGERVIYKRRSYPRELKLSIMQWASTTYKTLKDGSQKLISRYEEADRIDITPTTLKRWFDTKDWIERQKKRSRRTVSKSKRGQEDALEMRLYVEFKAT
jgi:hypothetical protein